MEQVASIHFVTFESKVPLLSLINTVNWESLQGSIQIFAFETGGKGSGSRL